MQTTYNLNPEAGELGGLAYVGMPSEILTCDNGANEVAFGHLVAKTAGSDATVEPFNNPNQDQYGVALLDKTIAIDAVTTLDDAYPAYSKAGVLKSGYVYVKVDQTVTSDDDVYARHSSTLAVQTITFDIDFVSSNSIDCTINGDVQSATVFNTNHNTTIAALATLIQAHEDVLTASASGRVITVTSVNKDAVTFVITVTGGASQAVDTIATTTTGVAGDQGVFRKDADSNKASLVSNAKFITGAASAGLAILKVDLL